MSQQHSLSLARLKINIFTLLKFAGRLSCNNSSSNLSIRHRLPDYFSVCVSVFLISDSSHEIHKSRFSHYSEEALSRDNIVLGTM